MFCSNCGTQVKESDNFCYQCAQDLQNVERDPGVFYSNQQKENSSKTDGVEQQKERTEHEEKILYVSISKLRLMGLSILTFGLYHLYWFDQNWDVVKKQGGVQILPTIRAIFAPIFAYSLFKRVLSSAEDKGYTKGYSPVLLAIFYFLFVILNSGGGGDLPYGTFLFVSVLLSLLVTLPLMPVQDAINFNNFQIEGEDPKRDHLTMGEWIFIIIGIIFWFIIFTGLTAS